MEQWMQMGRKLRVFVNPSTMPVAVKFLKKEDSIPEKSRRPLKDLKAKNGAVSRLCHGQALRMDRGICT